MQKHNLYRGTLLVIVGSVQRAIESDREQNDRHYCDPGKKPVDDSQKARRVRNINHRHAPSLIKVATVRINVIPVRVVMLPPPQWGRAPSLPNLAHKEW